MILIQFNYIYYRPMANKVEDLALVLEHFLVDEVFK